MKNIPSYLKNHKSQFIKNPRKTNSKWFKKANYGLFLHYGLYSLLERHEWVQFKERIPVKEYEKLINKFTASNFNAEEIVKFAANCGMKYINITTRHHDSFCLWNSKYQPFNSMNSPAKRDLLSELYDACEKHDMALFLYYSHARDWKHPHAPNNDKWGGNARPFYNPPEDSYKYGDEHDMNIYLKFVENQITELMDLFPNAAGIWLDGIAVPLSKDPRKFKCENLYNKIRNKSSHMLISYKEGVTGTEDFFSPEHNVPDKTDNEKIYEVCTTMQEDPVSWGYNKEAKHKSVEDVVLKYKSTVNKNTNLLLNTGPLPDGSINKTDKEVLLKARKVLDI